MMKRVAVYGLLLLAIVLLTGVSATIGWRPFIGPRARPLTDRRFEPTPARLERGAYLVNNVNGCVYCHSDGEPGTPPKTGHLGAGHGWAPEGMPWLVAPNITPDPETGAGTWSDDAIARAVREGIGHDGRALFPLMPYNNLRHMSDEDVASVVVYIRSLPAVHRHQPKSAIPFPVKYLINNVPEPLDAPVSMPNLADPVTRGRYLTTLASCTECHTPRDDKGQFVPGMEFGGGNTLTYTGKPSAAAANLTPSPNGIPYYNEDLFLETIRTGRVRERALSDLMPWSSYRNMTDEDLKSIFAYLKTLKPVDHFVDNTLPPTSCARCGLSHGGGERNKKST
jgi:mono/diheme cytochrome c family protein